MGGIFSKPKPVAQPKVPTPQESEVTSRKRQQGRASRIEEQDTLLSSNEERAKLLG